MLNWKSVWTIRENLFLLKQNKKWKQDKTKKPLYFECGGQRILWRSQLSPSIMGILGIKAQASRLAGKCHYRWAILLVQLIYFWMRKVCFSKNLKENVAIKNEWVKNERPQAEVWVSVRGRTMQTIKLIINVLSVQSLGLLCHHWHSIFGMQMKSCVRLKD